MQETARAGAMTTRVGPREAATGVWHLLQHIAPVVQQRRRFIRSVGALAIRLQFGQVAGMQINEQSGPYTVWLRRTNGFAYRGPSPSTTLGVPV